MKSWLNLIFSNFIGQWAYQFVTTSFKQKAILMYLKVLRTVRQSLLALVVLNITLQLMVLGFVGMAIAGVWLFTADDLQTKLYWLFGFFGFIFVIPLILLLVFFSQKTWIRVSGIGDTET